MSVADGRASRLEQGGAVGFALAILLLTLALGLLWSHVKLLWNDEFLSFYSDSVRTFADVLHVQLRSPISLDPPTYHLLSHFSMDALGQTATALRLPALMGFLLLEWSLFALVRRIAGARAALVAMVLPLCTASFRYAVEGRPYGLLLGLYAASVACWYAAAQRLDDNSTRSRILPLLGLWLSLAAAITSHYFGVLILLPVFAAEAVRTLQRRRFDTPILATLLAGAASVALILPFKAALAPYQQHYYTSTVNLRNVSQGYRELFVRYNQWPLGAQRVTAVLLAVAMLAFVIAAVRRFRQRPSTEPAALWTALLMLALLPFFGYLFGKFVTHTMEVRYVIAALIPFAVVIALLLEPALRSARAFYAVLGAEVVLGTLFAMVQIRAERNLSIAVLTEVQQTAPVFANTEEPIYIQTLSDDFLRTYYTADPLLRQRFVLLYDETREVLWLHHNTNAVTARNLQQFTPLRTALYADALAGSSALLLVAEPGGWNWLRPELEHARGLNIQPLGKVGTLQLVRIAASAPGGR